MEIVVDPCVILIRQLHSANNSAEKGSSHPIFSLHKIWKNTLNLTVTGDMIPRGLKKHVVKATTFLFVGCRVTMCFDTFCRSTRPHRLCMYGSTACSGDSTSGSDINSSIDINDT